MNCLHCYRIGISLLCLLVGWTGFVQAQTLSVGENAVAASGGCAITRDMAEDSPAVGMLEPKQWVTVQQTRDGMIRIQIETEEQSLEGWVPSRCLVTTEAYFADPVCGKSSWMERVFALDRAHPDAVARMIKTGSHYVLKIFDARGKLLWSGPEETSEEPDALLDPFTFFCGAEGDYWPEFLGDMNGDGKAELFMPAQHSSMESPLPLYLYTWDGKTFRDVSWARCLMEKSRDSGVYEWTEFFDETPDGTRWLFAPLAVNADGAVEWKVFEISGDALLSGQALFKMTSDLEKAALIRWTRPLAAE